MKRYSQEELDYAVRQAEHEGFKRGMKTAQEIFDNL